MKQLIRVSWWLNLKSWLNISSWAINFITKSITRSFIMLSTMMENKNTSFANISIPFQRSCSQEHDLRKGIEILAKFVFSFSIIVFNMMKPLVILLQLNRGKTMTISQEYVKGWVLLDPKPDSYFYYINRSSH